MTTRTRTPAEVEAGARMESQIAYIDSLAHEMTTRLPTGLTWSGVRRALDLALGDRWVILPRSAIAADAAAAPAVGVSDRGETAIEAARELLLMLHLEVMTGASLVSPAVETLMTELDNTIFAWDAAQMEPKGA